ncbi:hypothetical protein Bca101_008220 [Brassica carinata]
MSLPSPERVSLPSLKDIVLILVEYTNRWALEKLISQCPVLENVSIDRIYGDGMPILRVCSQSLLSFMHYWDKNDDYEKDRIVEIDAPMLKCLRISDGGTASFIIKNQPSLVEADIDTVFSLTTERWLRVANEIQTRDMVRDFHVGISKVKDLTIASSTLEVIYDYARYVQLPIFRNLYTLCVRFDSYMWEMLPVCPNLKTLVVPAGLINGWVDTAARLKVEHLDVSDSFSEWDPMMNPTVLYTCSNLVSLRLVGMGLPNPERVSLPSLKTLVLILIEFTNKWALENLISKCPVLENFCFETSYDDGIPILCVHSKSLLTFMHDAGYHEDCDEEDRFV